MKHDPNAGARYLVRVARAGEPAAIVDEQTTLGDGRRSALELADADLDGDCYELVEVVCERVRDDGSIASAVCFRHHRGPSEMGLRRALLSLRSGRRPFPR